MADGHGGARTPRNPAPVSGPGRLSKRTDGPTQKLLAPTGMAYGDHQALVQQESGAGMAQSPSVPTPDIPAPQGAQSGAGQYSGGPFNASTSRPTEPVTAGADSGPGPGSETLSLPGAPMGAAGPKGAMSNIIAGLAASDATGLLGQLYERATALGV